MFPSSRPFSPAGGSQLNGETLATMTRHKVALGLSGLLVISPLIVFTMFPVKRELGWIDANSGTMKYQTAWTFGYTTHARIEPSALDEWATKNGALPSRDWRLVTGTWKNLWGRSMGYGHGSAPQIYPLRDEMMDLFVAHSEDDELAAFISIIKNGSDAEQEDAVDSAVDKAIEAIENGG